MEARLQSSVTASALMRRAQAEGGFAALLARGDSQAGAMVVILVEKGVKARILERVLRPNASYSWQDTGPRDDANSEEVQKFLTRRRNSDPDLWILELDVPSAERFAAEMNEAV